MPPVLLEPIGQFCRDLNAKGYTYAEALHYWEHHGRPNQMDASGMGIPCQKVYPRADVEAAWGAEKLRPRCPSAAELEFASLEYLLRYDPWAERPVLVDIECLGNHARAMNAPWQYAESAAHIFHLGPDGTPTALDVGSSLLCEELLIHPSA